MGQRGLEAAARAVVVVLAAGVGEAEAGGSAVGRIARIRN